MSDEMLKSTLIHLIGKYKAVQSDQSTALLEQLTLTQYKNLAQIDVQTSSDLYQDLEKYLSDYLQVLNLEAELKRKKCALAASLKKLDEKFGEAAEETNKRNEMLKNGEISFLNPPPVVETPVFKKPAVLEKPAPLVEPTYSTRVLRENPQQSSAQRPEQMLDSIMKPPTFFSCNDKVIQNENELPKLDAFNIDDEVLNDHNISVLAENSRRRLKFDELDEDEKEKTPARSARTPAARTDPPKSLDLSAIPPPPVFTSSSGRLFNQK